jgi:hypothetical protein
MHRHGNSLRSCRGRFLVLAAGKKDVWGEMGRQDCKRADTSGETPVSWWYESQKCTFLASNCGGRILHRGSYVSKCWKLKQLIWQVLFFFAKQFRVARLSSVKTYQNGKQYMHQITTKCTKWLYVKHTNGRKIYHMATKYTIIFHSKALQNKPKLAFLVWK